MEWNNLQLTHTIAPVRFCYVFYCMLELPIELSRLMLPCLAPILNKCMAAHYKVKETVERKLPSIERKYIIVANLERNK